MAKAYASGDRFVAPAFRRAINEVFVNYVRSSCLFPTDMVELTCWMFENVASDRPLLQLLVNQFCGEWDDSDLGRIANTTALKALPAAFVSRVIRRYCHLKTCPGSSKVKDHCYSEHAADEEKVACGKAHMRYEADDDFGYFD